MFPIKSYYFYPQNPKTKAPKETDEPKIQSKTFLLI